MAEGSDVKALLERVAGGATDLRVDAAALERAIGRRRVGRLTAAAAAVIIGMTAAGLGVHAWRASPSAAPVAGGGTIPSVTPGSVTGSGGTGAVRGLACGAAVPAGLVSDGPRGMRLTVTDVSHQSGGAVPHVTVRLSSSSPATVGVLGVTPLQVLLVHHGTVADRLATYPLGPDAPPSNHLAEPDPLNGGNGGAGYSVQLSPGTPWTVTVAGPGNCSGADWAAVQHAGGDYAVIAVMSVPRLLDQQQTDSQDALLASAPVQLGNG